jgi:hypothetical protein
VSRNVGCATFTASNQRDCQNAHYAARMTFVRDNPGKNITQQQPCRPHAWGLRVVHGRFVSSRHACEAYSSRA